MSYSQGTRRHILGDATSQIQAKILLVFVPDAIGAAHINHTRAIIVFWLGRSAYELYTHS